ncbi:MAG TPA: universal stress protein [Terracidiphilus sp.]|nr:universal stress protein [Terracidiphilus sp.]
MADSSTSRWVHPAVILVATDLSDLDRLMPLALEQAAQTKARLILLHAIASSAAMSVDAVGMPYYDPSAALDFAEKMLRPWCEAAERRNIACAGLVREGHATQQITTAARQFKADRILLGTRSRSKLGKMLLGSVAEQVLRSVNLPVFTVGPEAHLPVQSGFEEHVVLHATTLRETSRPSAALACQMAVGMKAKLVLLNVLPPVDEMLRNGLPTGIDSAAMRELRILAAETGTGCCLDVEPVVVHGNPSIEILAEASERKASLIILGATHRSALENLTRDRTVYRVLAHARCPVLTLREPLASLDESTVESVEAYRG